MASSARLHALSADGSRNHRDTENAQRFLLNPSQARRHKNTKESQSPPDHPILPTDHTDKHRSARPPKNAEAQRRSRRISSRGEVPAVKRRPGASVVFRANEIALLWTFQALISYC
jgi:hypothetical protein